MGSIPTVINNIYLLQKLSGLNKPVTKENGPMEGPINQLTDGQPSNRDANLQLKTVIPTFMDRRMDGWTDGPMD